MVSFPNAKINLGLTVLRKRDDGFHDLESVFYPVGWTDVLEMLPSQTLQFRQSGLPIPGEVAENACLKAWQLLKADFDIPAVTLHLHKAIPIGAGLGGGSADAAFALKMLNELFTMGLSTDKMQHYARQLGSDCAFFIENQPKRCLEKGDVFENTAVNLNGKWIALVYPNLHISTAEAYRQVKPAIPEKKAEDILALPLAAWKDLLKNDFENSVFPVYPVLPETKKKLYEAGAVYVAMSGSGSTLFGIFETEPDIKPLFPAQYQIWQGILKH